MMRASYGRGRRYGPVLSRGSNDVLDRGGHGRDLLLGHRGVERDGHEPGVKLQGPRAAVVRQVGEHPEERMQRHGNEVDARADPTPSQRGDELAAVDVEAAEVQPDRVQVPRMTAVAPLRRKLDPRNVPE